MEALTAKGYTYEKDGAVWFGSTKDAEAQDDKDRVLVRHDGRPTYFLADISYHKNKYDRGYDTLIDILGADHHGYVPRMKAAVHALGHEEKTFVPIIHQLVHLIENGEQVKMSKRAGRFITLRELMDEVGTDVCRFFFASRTPNAHMMFDMDLAKSAPTKTRFSMYSMYTHVFTPSSKPRRKRALPIITALPLRLPRRKSTFVKTDLAQTRLAQLHCRFKPPPLNHLFG